jgi:hypothetical protein
MAGENVQGAAALRRRFYAVASATYKRKVSEKRSLSGPGKDQ